MSSSESLLNEDERKAILQKCFKQVKNVKYITSGITPLSGDIQGFAGTYFILKITYEIETGTFNRTFFVKTLPEITDQKGEELKEFYEKEVFFYDFLKNEFDGLGFDTSFAPDHYYSKGREILVLEDLKADNSMVLAEKRNLLDGHQLRAGLRSLALLHSASILFEEEMSKKHKRSFRLDQEYPDQFRELYFSFSGSHKFRNDLLKMCVERLKFMIDHLACGDETFKANFKGKLKLENLFIPFTRNNNNTTYRKTCSHGDLWYGNIFFQYENNHLAKKCVLIDYQVLRYFYPAFDVLLFIYMNTNRKFRKTHFDSLVEFYYNNLSETIKKHGYSIENILPKNEFYDSIEYVKPPLLFNVTSCGAFINTSTEIIEKHFGKTGKEEMEELPLFEESLRQQFLSDEWYRQFLSDLLYELYDSLVKS